VLAQRSILSFHHARQRAHQYAPLAGQIAMHLVFKGSFEQIARSDGYSQCQGAFGRRPV